MFCLNEKDIEELRDLSFLPNNLDTKSYYTACKGLSSVKGIKSILSFIAIYLWNKKTYRTKKINYNLEASCKEEKKN